MIGGLYCATHFGQMLLLDKIEFLHKRKAPSYKAKIYQTFLALVSSTAVLMCLAILCFLSCGKCEQAKPDATRELFKIRILNSTGGFVEVREPGGDSSYHRVGTVIRPASTVVQGYAASVYAVPGTVSATAVHGIRIKVSGHKECRMEETRMFSILPKEFAQSPKGFGGHDAGASGICTDICTGEAIFRNLAPFVGNPVFVVVEGKEKPLPADYVPKDGDLLVISVLIPVRYPREIRIENKVGGLVRVVYSDGEQTIATVVRPVRGVGRFDATGYTGIGRINTNHTGVITISTAPIARGEKDGSANETRGGFMIQPSRHALLAKGMPQVLVVGPASPEDSSLEGAPPLFSGCIGLAYHPGNEKESFRVDIKATGADDWVPLPPIVGRMDDALFKLPGGLGALADIRIVFPEFAPATIKSEIERCSSQYLQARKTEAQKSGRLFTGSTLSIGLDSQSLGGVSYVCLYVDGAFRGISNDPSTLFSVNTLLLGEGDHLIEVRGFDSSGQATKSVKKSIFVQYPAAVPR
ncbi:MAG: hypothetical protein K6U00_00245 [Armatimonadetes bacterium]|nr:hypothetical protein [Armatimonadota bacterium]